VKEYHTRAAIIAHLNAKVEEEDWAAVSEAANDLSLLDILEARSRSAPKQDRQRRTGPLDA
jgi:hypothetical protein